MKTYNETRCEVVKIGSNDKGEQVVESTRYLVEDAANKAIKDANDNGGGVEISKSQTFKFYEAETVEEMFILCGDDGTEEGHKKAEGIVLDLFNRAGILKQQTEVRDILSDPEFQPTELVDLAESVATQRERRKADPQTKAAKALSALSPEQLKAVLALFQEQTA